MSNYVWQLKGSLSRQLLTGFGISLIAVGFTTLWLNYRSIHSDLEQQVQKRAESIAQGLEFATEGAIEVEDNIQLQQIVQNYATLPALVEIAIVSADGKIIASSSTIERKGFYFALKPELTLALAQASRTGEKTHQELRWKNRSVFVQILPFTRVLFDETGRRALAIAILDLDRMQQDAWATFFQSTVTLVAGIFLILLCMGWFIQKTILHPLKCLHKAALDSQNTGRFAMPAAMPANEIKFLARTFETIFKQLETHEQLHREVEQRKQIEAALRESETREREKSQELQKTIQELQQTQAQLIQTEKMSSLGRMVAGVAHEINNPACFIYGNLAHASQYFEDLLELVFLYQRTYPEATPEIQTATDEIDLEFLVNDVHKLLASMKVGTERIRDIVLSLRNFSRLEEAELKWVDIHEGIKSTLVILQNRLNSQSEMERQKPPIEVIEDYDDIPPVLCYAGLLNQVFLNIIGNAIDALEDKQKREREENTENFSPFIHIRTELLRRDTPQGKFYRISRHQASGLDEESRSRVAIYIKDNGKGISEKISSKIFDPFFTTKPVGKGTGLGLSISYQIVVEKHGGELKCISAPGEGTEFIIELPIE